MWLNTSSPLTTEVKILLIVNKEARIYQIRIITSESNYVIIFKRIFREI